MPDIATTDSRSAAHNLAVPARAAIIACMLAGMCTFLNVYDTQPLLPYLRLVFDASEIAVSLTVSATILAMALMAPITGLVAESIGRKKVIVPSLYALTVPTLLASTSQSLDQLIFWRFMQGLFVPGVIVVIMAYINEEFPRQHVGRAMSAYISGTVLGGFLGRYISGVVAHHFAWRHAFLVIGLMNLAGAILVHRALPRARNFVRATSVRGSLGEGWRHLHIPDCWPSLAWGSRRCFAWSARSPMQISILPIHRFGSTLSNWAACSLSICSAFLSHHSPDDVSIITAFDPRQWSRYLLPSPACC